MTFTAEYTTVEGEPHTRRRWADESGQARYVETQHQCMQCGLWFADQRSRHSLYWHMCPECSRDYNPHQESPTGPAPLDVPAAHATATLTILPAKNRAALQRWPQQTTLCGIYGIPGSGKTTACWARANELSKAGRRVVVREAVDLRQEWLRSFGNVGREQAIERTIRTTYLVLDDISACAAGDGWGEFLHRALDLRIEQALATLITSALRGDELQALYGVAIRSRLKTFAWTWLPAKDHRQPKGDA